MTEPTEPIEPASTDPEVAARDEAERSEAERAPASNGRARRVALLSLRLVAGTVAVIAAAATVGAVGLIPFPTTGVTPPSTTVTPVAADQLRACAGAALRFGDETGADADKPEVIGLASVRSDAVGADLQRSTIAKSDAGGGSGAPTVLTIASGDGADLAGAQSQSVDVRDFRGFDAAGCAEPSGSIWLVGGATTTGRTTVLTMSNPTEVAAQVSLEIYGEDGAIDAPGMTGIDVPAGSQRVLSLAGFAPGVLSPVVHVEARGGQVTAYLQQSIVRGLDATGMDLVGASSDPATEQTFTGVRIFDSLATSRTLALEDWDDAAPVARIFNPGTEPLDVTVSVTPLDTKIAGTSFPVTVDPGMVVDQALDSGIEVDTGVSLEDGVYTVTMTAEKPFVGGVRTTAAKDIGELSADTISAAPPSDFAWYSAAPRLTGDALFVVAPGPDAVLAVMNPTSADVTLTLTAQGADDVTLKVPAGGSASVPVSENTYVLKNAKGMHATVTYAADDALGAYPVTSARPVSGPIVIRP